MLVFSIQFTNVSTKYNTIHSTVVVHSHSICVWLWTTNISFPKDRNEMINENKTRHDTVYMFYD